MSADLVLVQSSMSPHPPPLRSSSLPHSLQPLRPLSSLRPAELPGRQPPVVAHTGGGDVLLVASDRCVHHAIQTQPGLPPGAEPHLISRSLMSDKLLAFEGAAAVLKRASRGSHLDPCGRSDLFRPISGGGPLAVFVTSEEPSCKSGILEQK